MSENQPGPIHSNPSPGPGSSPDVDGEMQTRIAAAPFQLSQDPVTDHGRGHASADGAGVPAPAYEHLGELPVSYGTQSVYLVAYDPRQLFAYWDLDPAEAAARKYALHICHPDGAVETRVDIQPSEAGRYLGASRPGGTYYVELGAYGRNGSWQALASSGRVTLPAEGLAGEAEPKFATLPFHLSFQRLMELIEGAMGSKEDLTAALARLQRGERPGNPSLLGVLSHLSAEQLRTLEMILGEKFSVDSAGGIHTGGQSHFFRDRHEAAAASGGSSETLSSGLPGGEAKITSVSSENFSSFFTGARGETLSSGGFGSESLGSSGHASEVTLTPLGSETLSSSFGSFGSETVSSFGGGMGSDSLAAFAAGLSSETLSSGGAGSETLLSLLAGMSSESLASFFAAFAGGSESLSSASRHGPSSEAWRMAGGGAGISSGERLSSDYSSLFLHAVESNLDVLGSLFSPGFSSASSADAGSSPGGGSGGLGGPGGGGGSSENLARKKSLW